MLRIKQSAIRVGAALVWVGLLPAAAAASESADGTTLNKAERLILQGDFVQGCGFLDDLMAADEPRVAFLAGRCALERGRPQAAVGHFRALLERDPEQPRVRAELGKALMMTGDAAAARTQFERVLESPLPSHVRSDIDALIRAIDSGQRLSGRFSVGLIDDTNINVGPRSSTVRLFGLPFELSPDAAPQSDLALRVSALIQHDAPLSDSTLWRSELSMEHMDYRQSGNVDFRQLALATGPRWQRTDLVVHTPLLLERSDLGHNKYSEAAGAAVQLEYLPSPAGLFTASIAWQMRQYSLQPDQNGPHSGLSLAWRQMFGTHAYLEAGWHHTRQASREPTWAHRLNTISLGAYLASGQWSLFVEPRVTRSNYDAQEVLFDAPRNDHQISMTVNLGRSFDGGRWLVLGGATWVDQRSNIELFDYRRRLVTMQLVHAF